MPTYDYQCRSCGSITEVIHSMREAGPSVCERCGGELRRVLYPAGIIFKGSGFYRTDSRDGATSSSSATPTSGGDKATESGASKASDTASGSSPPTKNAGEASAR